MQLKKAAETKSFDPYSLQIWDEALVKYGIEVHKKRKKYSKGLLPFFERYYQRICDGNEKFDFTYESQLTKNDLAKLLQENIEKDKKESVEEKEKDKKTAREPKKVSVTIPLDEQIRIKNLSKKQRIGVQIEGASDVLIKLSQCCQPIPGDNVIGFITRGRGITVHKMNCPSLKRLRNEKERFINIVWEESSSKFYPVKIAVHALDRQNLLKDIADEISLCHTNIIKAEAQVKEEGVALLKFILEVKSNKHLKEIETRIRKIKNVTDVYKLNEKVIIK